MCIKHRDGEYRDIVHSMGKRLTKKRLRIGKLITKIKSK